MHLRSTAAALIGLSLVSLAVMRRKAVQQRRRSVGHLLALREALALRQALQHKLGLDIGGTLAKIVLASETSEPTPFRTVTLDTATTHRALGFTARSGGLRFTFVSTPTETLEETARSIAERLGYPAGAEGRQIVAAGGGAHRYHDMFHEVLQVDILPLGELQAVVEGLLFLAAEGPATELFTVDDAGVERDVDWPDPLFPFLLVNMGSGVSVLRVDGKNQHTRVGGTACGGATFLGLGRALTGVQDFHALLALAARGDEALVDKTVGDIYGSDGCVDLGMPPTFTAASFGKIGTQRASTAKPQSEDVVRSLLRMVAQASVVLAKAYATQADCLGRIVFAGGFLQDNELARREIAKSMALVGGRALFCRHSEFLGALGSIGACIDKHHRNSETEPSRSPSRRFARSTTVRGCRASAAQAASGMGAAGSTAHNGGVRRNSM